jgi:hypothetical protein
MVSKSELRSESFDIVKPPFGMTKEMMCEMISGRSRCLFGGGCVEWTRGLCIESMLSSLKDAIAAELRLEKDESDDGKDMDRRTSIVALWKARRCKGRLSLNISRN